MRRNNLVAAPFTPLTQQYQTCSNDPVTAFFTQVGVSAGNVTLLSPAGVLLVLCLLAGYQYCTGRYIPRTYGSAEKSAALEALAVAMLLVRDKRVKARQTKASSQVGRTHATTPAANSDDADKAFEPDLDCYEIGLLADLVEQLGNIAPAAESQHYLYREEVGEAVSIDWKQLSAKITGSGKTKHVRKESEDVGVSRGTVSGTEMTAMEGTSSSV